MSKDIKNSNSRTVRRFSDLKVQNKDLIGDIGYLNSKITEKDNQIVYLDYMLRVAIGERESLKKIVGSQREYFESLKNVIEIQNTRIETLKKELEFSNNIIDGLISYGNP